MKPIYCFFMGMMTGIVIIGVGFICIFVVIKVIDGFHRMDEMGRELKRLKWRQGITEGKLRDWSRMKPRIEDIFRLHEIEALGGKTPLSMLNSRPGTDLLLDKLSRIETGGYS